MKTGRRKLNKMSEEMRKKLRQEITCIRKESDDRDCRVMYGTFAHVVPGTRVFYYLASTRNVWKAVTELLFQCLRLVFGFELQEPEGTV